MTTSAQDNYPAAHYWLCTSWHISQMGYKTTPYTHWNSSIF